MSDNITTEGGLEFVTETGEFLVTEERAVVQPISKPFSPSKLDDDPSAKGGVETITLKGGSRVPFKKGSVDTSALLLAEIQKLNPSSIVELFELDATELGESDYLRFHNGTSGFRDRVIFQGFTFEPLPISIKGFQTSSTGEPARPTMTIMNLGGFMSSLILQTNDLVGAKVRRIRTFARFLDGEPEAAAVMFPIDEFTIEQKTRENRMVVEFELGTGFDLDGVRFPRRQVVANYCAFDYRMSGCGFAQLFVVADANNVTKPGVITYRGVWNETTPYQTGQTVTILRSDGTTHFVQATLGPLLGRAQGPIQSPSSWTLLQRYRGDINIGTPTAGAWDADVLYLTNDVVYRERYGMRVYFLAKRNSVGAVPPSQVYWQPDQCSKTLKGCSIRFDVYDQKLPLPYGGFPGILNLPSQV